MTSVCKDGGEKRSGYARLTVPLVSRVNGVQCIVGHLSVIVQKYNHTYVTKSGCGAFKWANLLPCALYDAACTNDMFVLVC